MLNEFKDLRALLYKTEMSKEILSQLVLLEIKLLEVETRMGYAKEISEEINNIVVNNVCEQNSTTIAVLLNQDQYDRIYLILVKYLMLTMKIALKRIGRINSLQWNFQTFQRKNTLFGIIKQILLKKYWTLFTTILHWLNLLTMDSNLMMVKNLFV
jgi:hypothetical protein